MDDTISRQAAIRWVKTECNPYGKPTLDFESGKKVIEHLEQMPSAQPEPPKAIRPKFELEDRYIKNHFQTFPHCPKCNYELETGDCYCRVCGCHLDWGEDDE